MVVQFLNTNSYQENISRLQWFLRAIVEGYLFVTDKVLPKDRHTCGTPYLNAAVSVKILNRNKKTYFI